MPKNKLLYEGSVIIERALEAARLIKPEPETTNNISSVSIREKVNGIIFTDPEKLEAMDEGINKVLLKEFNKREIKTKDFAEFILQEGYATDIGKATSFVNNKIKILRENCDMKFSNILLICKFLKIQVDFIIN